MDIVCFTQMKSFTQSLILKKTHWHIGVVVPIFKKDRTPQPPWEDLCQITGEGNTSIS